MEVKKPGKRVILYWFVEYGFFFIITALFVSATVLKYTSFYTLTYFFLELTLIVLLVSVVYLVVKWLRTEYLLLNKHVFLKKEGETYIIPYKRIKEVTFYGNLLQHAMGTTNVLIKTKDNKGYYMEGIKDYDAVEEEILSKIHT